MTITYLFRVDMAKDNDAFFTAIRNTANHVYAGVDMRIGSAGWVPDLVRVIVDEAASLCSIVIIELESAESTAMISCRKFLPESSHEIVASLRGYLDRVIRQCRSSADSREKAFAQLQTLIDQSTNVRISTAGALRSSTAFVEEFPLLDQPGFVPTLSPTKFEAQRSERRLEGLLRLSQGEAAALGRCILILDAVIRRLDHSSATLHTWRAQHRSQPLKRLLKAQAKNYPTLFSFIVRTRTSGFSLDFDALLLELVKIWSDACHHALDANHVRGVVTGYYPEAISIKAQDKMELVFEKARQHLYSDEVFGVLLSRPNDHAPRLHPIGAQSDRSA